MIELYEIIGKQLKTIEVFVTEEQLNHEFFKHKSRCYNDDDYNTEDYTIIDNIKEK